MNTDKINGATKKPHAPRRGADKSLKNWEDSELYKKAYELVIYTYIILPKLPKVARPTLGEQIENRTLSVMRSVIEIGSYHNRERRFEMLAALDADLKVLCVLARVANKHYTKQITAQNREAWLRKLSDIIVIVIGWGQKLSGQKVNQE
jgi:hypothetical protein